MDNLQLQTDFSSLKAASKNYVNSESIDSKSTTLLIESLVRLSISAKELEKSDLASPTSEVSETFILLAEIFKDGNIVICTLIYDVLSCFTTM